MAPHVLPRGAPARTRARRRDAERAPGPNEQAASLARSPRLGHGSACLQWRVGSRPRECRVLIRRLRAAIQALASSQEDCLQHITSPQGLPRLYQALESSQPGTGLVPVGCGQLHLDVRGSHVVPGIHRGAQLQAGEGRGGVGWGGGRLVSDAGRRRASGLAHVPMQSAHVRMLAIKGMHEHLHQTVKPPSGGGAPPPPPPPLRQLPAPSPPAAVMPWRVRRHSLAALPRAGALWPRARPPGALRCARLQQLG